ncbi:MAG: autotransporter-associated beta strand repeat-containing protein [Verrucomicrobiota bacterium]
MKPKNNNLQYLGFIAFAVAGLSSTQSVHAAAATWDGSVSGNWADTSGADTNFTGGAGTNGILAFNDSLTFTSATGLGGTTLNNNLTSAAFNIASISFNAASPAYTIGGNAFTLSGGITNNSNSLQTINNAITLTSVDRTFTTTNASGGLTLGGAISGTTSGAVIFAGPGTTTLSGTNTFNTKGANFDAFIVGGATTTPGNVVITGATTVDGTGFADARGYLDIHGNSTLTIETGGSFALNTSTGTPSSIIGQDRTGTSTVSVNGGSFTIGGNSGFALGNNRNDATGVLTISSGTATITAGSATLQDARNFVAMGRDSGHGIINLDGGTLATGRQFVLDGSSGTGAGGFVGPGTANFKFNGGTLQAQANQTSGNGWFETATTGNFKAVTTTVKVGGAKIDTNGFNTNINTVLAHDSGLGGTADGGLTKSGAGTLTLGAANTYTGKTTVTAGTLALGSGGSIANSTEIALNGGNFNVTAVPGFTIGANQSLTGNGSITGDITVSGNLAIGASPGTMTFNNNLTLGGGSTSDFEFTLSSFTLGSFDLAVGGDGSQEVVFGGLLNLLFDSGETYANNSSVQIFDFETYGGDFTVNFSGLGAGQSATFDSGTGFVTIIPEPGSVLMSCVGLALVLLRRRRI